MKVKIKKGQKFYAVIKKGPNSKTLGGEEAVGRRIGPFIATCDSSALYVDTEDRFFSRVDFKIEV